MAKIKLIEGGNKLLLAAAAIRDETRRLVDSCVNYDRVMWAKDMADLTALLNQLKEETATEDMQLSLLTDPATDLLIKKALSEETPFTIVLENHMALRNRIVVVETYPLSEPSYPSARIGHLVIDVARLYDDLTFPLNLPRSLNIK